MAVRDNVAEVKRQVEEVLQETEKSINDITIVAVTKTVDLETAEEIVKSGIKEIGESRVQEGIRKREYLATKYNDIRWHLVGHLQTNKAKKAVRIFDLIHSVDSLRLAKEISREAEKINKEQKILVEVNVSGEESKYGLKEEEVLKFIDEVDKLKNLKVLGLMTIAPFVEDKKIVRDSFKRLKELYNKVKQRSYKRTEAVYLSMGMTDDFKEALKEGANILRIGRAFFK